MFLGIVSAVPAPAALLRALLAFGAALCGSCAFAAAASWKPEKPVELIVPDSPGGGQDRTLRVLQKLLQDNALVSTPINVINKPGGSGNIAYAYLGQFPGDGHYLAIATATMLTNHALGLSPYSYTDFTPIAILYGESIGFAVNADSPIKTGRDMIERLKKN